LERRQSQRLDYHLLVNVEYASQEAKVRGESTRFINISEGGAYLPLRHQPVADSEIKFNILAPDDFSRSWFEGKFRNADVVECPMILKVAGRVVRTVADPAYPGGFCLGVEFEGPIRIVRGTEK